jgi:hypothetical protein
MPAPELDSCGGLAAHSSVGDPIRHPVENESRSSRLAGGAHAGQLSLMPGRCSAGTALSPALFRTVHSG